MNFNLQADHHLIYGGAIFQFADIDWGNGGRTCDHNSVKFPDICMFSSHAALFDRPDNIIHNKNKPACFKLLDIANKLVCKRTYTPGISVRASITLEILVVRRELRAACSRISHPSTTLRIV
jgi:hypothetical protein